METLKTIEINGKTYVIDAVQTNQNIHAEYFDIVGDGVLLLKPEYRGAAYGAILFSPGMDVTAGYYYVDKYGKEQTLCRCKLTTSSTAVEDNGYPQTLEDPDYFEEIARDENRKSDNGAGMAGSKNYALPELLYIPAVVNGTTVKGLHSLLFDHNQAIKKVVLPGEITSIPEQCFFGCQKLESVYNTEHILHIGKRAFSRCVSLKEIRLPNLRGAEGEITTSAEAFGDCISLEYAHIGKITALPDEFFRGCFKLHKIDHDTECQVTHIGKGACLETHELREADFIDDVTFMDIGAFFKSGIDYDWSKLPESVFAQDTETYKSYPTSLQLNPVDFWSDCKPIACHNPTPTHFCQLNPRWITRWIGNTEASGYRYGNGCAMFALIHAFCGLNQLFLSDVAEFEDIANRMVDNDPGIWEDYTNIRNGSGIKEWGERLGLSITEYNEYNTSTMQKLYEALYDGNYAYVSVPIYTTRRGSLEINAGGHAALISGVTEDGRLIITDSNEMYPEDMTVGNEYSALYQSNFYPGDEEYKKLCFCIISKPIAYSRYDTVEDALAKTNPTAEGKVGAYYDKYGKTHITLLGDVDSGETINIQKDCTLHLNGYTLTFTAAEAYLNIDTAKEVVIDGTVVRCEKQNNGSTKIYKSMIKKKNVVGLTGHIDVIKTTGTNLTIYGGVYENTNSNTASNKDIRVISSGVATPPAEIRLNDCEITVSTSGQGRAVYGVLADYLEMNGCTVRATTENLDAAAVSLYLGATIKNSNIFSETTGTGAAFGINTFQGGSACDLLNTNVTVTVDGYRNTNHARGVYVTANWEMTVTDCKIHVVRKESDTNDTDTLDTLSILSLGRIETNGTNVFEPAYSQD